MSQIENQLKELDETELKKLLCLRCIVAGYSLRDSLYEEKEMVQSSATNELICHNCSTLESEHGYKKMSKGETSSAEKMRQAFEDYKKTKRLC
jgi:hypothetical protein